MERGLLHWDKFLVLTGLSCLVLKRGLQPRYIVSKKKFVCPIAVILIFLIMEITLSRDLLNSTLMISTVTPIAMISFAAAIVISATVNSYQYAAVKTAYLSFDRVLIVDYKQIRMAVLKWSVGMVIFMLASIVAGHLDPTVDDKTYSILVPTLAVYIGQFYSWLTSIHFLLCLFMIRQSFALINKRLEKLAVWGPLKAVDIQGSFEEAVLKHTTEVEIIKFRDEEMIGSPVCRLRALRRIYHRTFMLCKEVNDLFSTRNAITVAANFIIITVTIYGGIDNLAGELKTNQTVCFLDFVNYFKWTVLSIHSMFCLITPCMGVHGETVKTSMITQGLLTGEISKEMKKELKLLTTQLSNEQVIFSPHDLFQLNNKLLLSASIAPISIITLSELSKKNEQLYFTYSLEFQLLFQILATLLSYLVVLVQFRIRT